MSPEATALIGAYLYELGIKDPRAIAYFTMAEPNSMMWISSNALAGYGIAVTYFNLSQDQWSWAREALAARADFGRRRRIDPPGHFSPATTANVVSPQSSVTDKAVRESWERADRVRATTTPSPEMRRLWELLAEATRRVESGDVAGAREMLAAAEDGSQGLVLFALAETYDPAMLTAWGTRSAIPDVARARALYRKALTLAAPSSIAVWPSWPQACILPFIFEA
jgi:hypothetical protein